ncbi:MAG: transcription-repair coupling factor [Bacteroidales bacterium]|nr:transcription-repair coupling factor [Bacteroidales bacterium]
MKELLEIYSKNPKYIEILHTITQRHSRLNIQSLAGSAMSFCVASSINKSKEFTHLIIISDKEKAAYFCNDIEQIFGEQDLDYSKKNVLFYPSAYKLPYQVEETDNANILLRAEVLNRLNNNSQTIIITYPEALLEKVISKQLLTKNTLKINAGESLSVDFVIDVLDEYAFERVDFVFNPGQYAVRGGIIDVFSFADEYPYRVEFFGDDVESLRTFDVVSQLTIEEKKSLVIVPNIQNETITQEKMVSLVDYFGENTIVWADHLSLCLEKLDKEYEFAERVYLELENKNLHLKPNEIYNSAEEFKKSILEHSIVELGSNPMLSKDNLISFNTSPQPSFNKNFNLLVDCLKSQAENSFTNFFCVENPKQKDRIEKIIKEFGKDSAYVNIHYLMNSITSGFIDNELKVAVFTDHELFERYHKYKVRDQKQNREALTLKDLMQLKPGDFITHIDYGVGKFAGLEKLENNGKQQETIRLVYKDNDILYVSIHALHKISRYSGKDGIIPTLHRLGSNTWNNLKNKTKQRVKDIAKDLIALYAKRKASLGFAYSADSYLQHELEASFIYEDTPDQDKTTKDVKHDMESRIPMDRLVCGDVGFGKTEIAIRAAFKAVADSKQVAVLVPTTILAFQHFKTFSDRLDNMPCRVDYINRFRSTKEKNQIIQDLKQGKIDILIGTHKLLSKEIEFKDLGLFIIDEEHKFGVAMKEKLKKLKINIDTLTLTATPIPRTLQFSLMGARDLSIINTAPQNRQPVTTQVSCFEEEVVRDAILFEISRGGQVYFVHNRVQNIEEIAGLVKRLVPDAKVVIGHGQMKGEQLEEVMYSFIEGDFDVLVSTTIIENGLDIPNANTFIINDAQNYGLSDLHQLRGRVGRSNKKAYCYLLTPPLSLITDEARKRLQAIEDFSNIGSGFSIAMRDLDIRGAGNILGGEQSGFISEIGFDMYHKILNEAIEELKQTDFKELYEEEEKQKRLIEGGYYTKECNIETDLEILIPDQYITNIVERLNLYKELDGLETDQELEVFRKQLKDRFGNIPKQTLELIDTIKLRRIARKIGIEKLVLKRDKMVATFGVAKGSEYFNSEIFGNVLTYVQSYPTTTQLKEVGEKLSLSISQVKSVSDAIKIFAAIYNMH